MNNIEKVYAAISSDPALLDRLFEETKPAEDAPVTRSMPWGNQAESNTELKEILGTDVTEDDINKVLDELKDNQVVQLYRQSEGAIDAKELLDYVGDLSGTKAGSDDKALRALFDGKLQLKEIIMIILLLNKLRNGLRYKLRSWFQLWLHNNLSVLRLFPAQPVRTRHIQFKL